MSTRRNAVNVLALAALGLCLVGCGGGRAGSIRHNLTPELSTMTQRPVDNANMFWSTWNESARMATDDFHRAALYDRPSRMEPYPIGR